MPRISKRGVPVMASSMDRGWQVPALYCFFSQRSRSGFNSALASGVLHVGAGDDADAGVDPPLDCARP